jgi:hypothetical protein
MPDHLPVETKDAVSGEEAQNPAERSSMYTDSSREIRDAPLLFVTEVVRHTKVRDQVQTAGQTVTECDVLERLKRIRRALVGSHLCWRVVRGDHALYSFQRDEVRWSGAGTVASLHHLASVGDRSGVVLRQEMARKRPRVATVSSWLRA